MKVAYVIGPYRSNTINGTHDNIEKARRVAIKYWKLGYAVICPHLNTAYMDGASEDSTWLDGDLEILKRVDTIIVMKGWENSRGSQNEIDMAKKCGKEFVYE